MAERGPGMEWCRGLVGSGRFGIGRGGRSVGY